MPLFFSSLLCLTSFYISLVYLYKSTWFSVFETAISLVKFKTFTLPVASQLFCSQMYCFITTSSGTCIVTALSQAILFKVSKGNISQSGSSAPLHKVTLLQAVCHEAMPGCGMACRVGFICGARGWHDLFFTSLSADGQTASGSVLEVEFLQSARGF